MGNIICVIDKKKADELIALGFKCTPQKVQNGTIYQFMKSPELDKYIASVFSNQDFFINNNMTF